MNKNKNLIFIKKILVVNYKGGKCKICNNDNILQLCLHHRDTDMKEEAFDKLKFRRWSEIKNELDKCDLLCHNCHKELHYNSSSSKDDLRRVSKSIYIEYKGDGCIDCGYNKCQASLIFHHIKGKNDKNFWIGNLGNTIGTIGDLTEKIMLELDKCELLCANCHTLKHTDIEYFNTNKELLYEKAKNHKEVQPKLDREKIMMMYNSGMKQVDIIKEFKCSKSTISEIIKKNKILEM
jgi:hypothetical protein